MSIEALKAVVLGHNPAIQRGGNYGPFCDALTKEGRSHDFPHGRLSTHCAKLAKYEFAGHQICGYHYALAAGNSGWRPASDDDEKHALEVFEVWRQRGIAS